MISIILPYYNRKIYLKTVLDSFLYFYEGRKDLQIVIVDDGSDESDGVEEFESKYNLNLKIVRIDNKRGINPCYPYNVGVKHSDGDILVLSSPDIIHTNDLFKISNNFELLTNKSYLQFSVFCVTEPNIKRTLLDTATEFKYKKQFITDAVLHKFYENLGSTGCSYANKIGAWYTHSQFKNDCYNFVSACTKDTYYKLSGFNEAFVKGAGYDDADFRDRLLRHVNNNIIWHDVFVGIHIDHPAVSNDNNSNYSLYEKLKVTGYEKNNDWGLL